jgi:aminopeptidase N
LAEFHNLYRRHHTVHRAIIVSFVAAVGLCLLISPSAIAGAQRPSPALDQPDSGGPLLPEQAAYDVKSYDISLRIDPSERSIVGATVIIARVVHPLSWFVFDLDPTLTIRSVTMGGSTSAGVTLNPERRGRRVWALLPRTKQPGASLEVRIAYDGKPRVSPSPPWSDGFVWSKTADGHPWAAVACQTAGADVWWPCKDHPTDEPDRVTMHFTVPKPLVCASNGKLTSTQDNSDGTRTFHWAVSTPINNYAITVNIAPYREVKAQHKSIDGTIMPVVFYALPEHEEKARTLVQGWLKQLRFLEERLGPYPFRADKVGAAETPYLGMEHQTITAYGDRFRDNEYGFDWLMFHEFTHEWFGNLVTCPDWNDMWIHEGLTTYMEALYAEALKGEAAYHRYAATFPRRSGNRQPIAPREIRSAQQIYGGDIYFKGAAVLHTLRFLIGKKSVNTLLRRVAYPSAAEEKIKTGAQCHFTTTEDVRQLAEEISGKKLDWFFNLYVRQEKLPILHVAKVQDGLELNWETPGDMPFPMPVEIEIEGNTRRIEMPNGRARVALSAADTRWKADPRGWVLSTVKNGTTPQ